MFDYLNAKIKTELKTYTELVRTYVLDYNRHSPQVREYIRELLATMRDKCVTLVKLRDYFIESEGENA